jgi:hypothetical protein
MMWANTPMFPVKFDAQLNEYSIVYAERHSHLMRYCFWCGGKLPESKRSDLFAVPEHDEMAHAAAVLKEAKSMEDVLNVLGEPQVTMTNELLARTNGAFGFRRQWKYTRRWKTIEVVVIEMDDGSLQLAFMPKGMRENG